MGAEIFLGLATTQLAKTKLTNYSLNRFKHE